ncbi:hypothetical protein [Catenuloplanes atrovinosus]|uniref:Uncharacterized protein n=1 Tax=Catenuloplanes atrovinosus TaxID=137266 RepID=A0AAE3YQ56_9ACTN|nr:hypothetical protein [Catenuloplanes atrovinosus]MDR7277237.1 hypothetical protein [Catenuloplanes atrovinosus]
MTAWAKTATVSSLSKKPITRLPPGSGIRRYPAFSTRNRTPYAWLPDSDIQPHNLVSAIVGTVRHVSYGHRAHTRIKPGTSAV